MRAQEEPHQTGKGSDRGGDGAMKSRVETEGNTDSKRGNDRDKRWTDAKAEHWHSVDYTRETQARSETGDRS